MGDLLLTAWTGVKLLNCRWAHHLASNKFQPWEAWKYWVWWKRDNAGVAERFGEQLRKTSVHKKCVQQEGGGDTPWEKCKVLPGERSRNSLIYELDVLILAEEKMVKCFVMLEGVRCWVWFDPERSQGVVQVLRLALWWCLVLARDHGPKPASNQSLLSPGAGLCQAGKVSPGWEGDTTLLLGASLLGQQEFPLSTSLHNSYFSFLL